MKSILVGLTLISWTALSQPFTLDSLKRSNSTTLTYCLPIEKARSLVADALRLRLSDSLLHTQSQRVELLESEKTASYKSFSNLLKLSEQKYEKQKEITADFIRLSESWKSEADYYRKRYQKQRRQKKIVIYGAVVLLGLIIMK